MKTLHVYDPAMCCSTGVCGPQVDPVLVRFAADLKWLAAQRVDVQRFSLSQNPAAFAQNEVVRTALADKGDTALPLLIVDGKVGASGRYPDRKELGRWFNLGDTTLPKLSLTPSSSDCCGRKC
jgi:hypothetical protein